jgi:hypothetical protein
MSIVAISPTIGSLGDEIGREVARARGYDLNPRRDDDVALLKPELSLALSFDPTPTFQAFLNVALSRASLLAGSARNAGESEGVVLELKEAYVRAGRLSSGPSAQIGRQRFEDERKWLYDEDLDAVRLRYGRGTRGRAVSEPERSGAEESAPRPRARAGADQHLRAASDLRPPGLDRAGRLRDRP